MKSISLNVIPSVGSTDHIYTHSHSDRLCVKRAKCHHLVRRWGTHKSKSINNAIESCINEIFLRVICFRFNRLYKLKFNFCVNLSQNESRRSGSTEPNGEQEEIAFTVKYDQEIIIASKETTSCNNESTDEKSPSGKVCISRKFEY